MVNNIWNNKASGIVGAAMNVCSILWARFADWITSQSVMGNVRYHGENIRIMRGCIYRYPQWIEIGDNVIIGRNTSMIAEVCKEYDNLNNRGYLQIENGVSIGNCCEIDFSGGVRICEMAHIAHHVQISTHDHGYDYRNAPIGRSLEIGVGAFVGSRSIILHNCSRIGNNAVIGTGSIVTKDVPDNAIVAGNPARIIKFIN